MFVLFNTILAALKHAFIIFLLSFPQHPHFRYLNTKIYKKETEASATILA